MCQIEREFVSSPSGPIQENSRGLRVIKPVLSGCEIEVAKIDGHLYIFPGREVDAGAFIADVFPTGQPCECDERLLTSIEQIECAANPSLEFESPEA
jgi:hypothetical protein